MAAYIVIPVIVLTIMAIYFMVYMYDRKIKSKVRSTATTPPPATTCTNVRQDGIVYTISNTPNGGTGNAVVRPVSDTTIHIEHDGRGGPPPPQYGYTSQNLIVVTTIPRDLPPSYEQAVTTGRNNELPGNRSNDTEV